MEFVRQITAVLLFGPPVLATVTWLCSRSWTRAVQGTDVTPLFRRWERVDFWIYLLIMETVMFLTAAVQHKL